MNTLRLARPVPVLLLISACASEPPPPPEEIYVGQVQYVATAQEAKHGFYYSARGTETIYGVVPRSHEVKPATELMKSCGSDASADGSFVLVRFYYFWFDASKSIASFAPWAMVAPGLKLDRGNLVEVEVRTASAKSRCAVVTKVRSPDLDGAECEYHDNKVDSVSRMLNRLSPAGGPGAASLYCPFLQEEGWKQKPLGPFGGSCCGGYVWSKAP